MEGVVLRSTRGFSSDTKYIALSHCWGNTKPRCMTTSKNYDRQCQKIPWADIPKTFREAMQYTQRLGVRYIWIDSVCIIQPGDDQYYDDWLVEAVRMSDYYYNAYVTLAAASSADCHGGLFSKQPDRKHCLFRATIGGKHCQFFAARTSEDVHYRNAYAEIQAHRWPLGTRGWVYQERLVSCRVLYFTTYQLIFDCFRGLASEEWSCYSHPEPEMSLKRLYWELLHDTTALLAWQKLIEDYSALRLTNLGDRLPAMAAIAQQVLSRQGPGGTLGSTYLCGLRASSLHSGLLWLVGDHEPQLRQDSRCLAPSWSWASYPKKVRHHWNSGEESYKSQIELVGDSLEFTASGRFGSCTGGYITIRAPVIDCVWEVGLDSHGSLDATDLLLDPDPSSPERRIIRFPPDYPAGFQELEGLKHLDEVKVKVIQVCSDPLGVLFLYQSPKTKLYRRLGAVVYSDGQISKLAPAGPGFPGVTVSGIKAVVSAPDFSKAGCQTLKLG
ncbi:hypothetical protein VPNG_03961 [Cytospora leucostoma]|uniref:Heterokaryon incompatibility domain-containing protein n=1 Tax=Cytospora leucostoma TaxID=1230097 RepID=A0A423XDW4_9PEZI|nr:hypothetical protein VPNG_03961 [Cytospora leucostoma]